MTCHDRMAPEDFDLLAGTRDGAPRPRAGGDARNQTRARLRPWRKGPAPQISAPGGA